jgi:hypothetical protein
MIGSVVPSGQSIGEYNSCQRHDLMIKSNGAISPVQSFWFLPASPRLLAQALSGRVGSPFLPEEGTPFPLETMEKSVVSAASNSEASSSGSWSFASQLAVH